MFLYVVHHADAVAASVDSQRPLSALGRAQATGLAEAARTRQVRPAAIWHSGKLRSRQTADVFLRVCNPSARFRAVRGLLPDDPVMWMETAVELETDDVLIVGHWPHLPALVRSLVGDGPLPLHGMIALERTAPARYVSRWVLAPSAADFDQGGLG